MAKHLVFNPSHEFSNIIFRGPTWMPHSRHVQPQDKSMKNTCPTYSPSKAATVNTKTGPRPRRLRTPKSSISSSKGRVRLNRSTASKMPIWI
ncbi:Pogo transposable element with ZNF domain [Tauraco erythrolophus]|uniref:Pogo transposable element with ZNF domain n=1 Tax=Tauraco erythrolophus TaxID=121530 RepID=A0A093C0L1_TAUER|nr:Pogo transposable element with ZNF domain [Tauraco erythrolophus]